MPVPYFIDEFVNQAAHDYSVPWNIFDAIDPVLPAEIEFLAEAYNRVAKQYGISDTGFAAARKRFIGLLGASTHDADVIARSAEVKRIAASLQNRSVSLQKIPIILSTLASESLVTKNKITDEVESLNALLREYSRTWPDDRYQKSLGACMHVAYIIEPIYDKYESMLADSYDQLVHLGFRPPKLSRDGFIPERSFPLTSVKDPAGIHQEWMRLNPIEQQELILHRPDLIGHLDGIPVAVRDQANRIELDILLNNPAISQSVKNHLNDIKNILKNEHMPQHMLMDLSPDGLKAAVVSGVDPDIADHVASYIPGTGDDLSNIRQGVERTDKMWRAANYIDKNKKNSVIAWYDYTPPPAVFDWFDDDDATNDKYALAARDDLDRFQNGLRATHHGKSDLTVVGHSYGTVVIGYAAGAADHGGHVLSADRVILIASPGTGAHTPEDLHLAGVDPHQVHTRIWECTDTKDPINKVDIVRSLVRDFGISPYGEDAKHLGDDDNVTVSEMGSIVHDYRRSSDSIHHFIDTPHSSGDIHGSYWDQDKNGKDNEALINIGKIIADGNSYGDLHKHVTEQG